MSIPLRIAVLGLTLSSSWGNGHDTTYRALLKGLANRGHSILFLERDQPWYSENRDLSRPSFCELAFYKSTGDLKRYWREIAAADAVIVGSYIPDGIAVGQWVQQTATGATAFYDIDTPVTLAAMARGECEYLEPALVPGYGLYLSFTGGPVLRHIETMYGAKAARALFCAVDTDFYRPQTCEPRFALGYLGTYSPDRQHALDCLLLDPAHAFPDRRFVVAGPKYPPIVWPSNVTRIEHVPPADHPAFYGDCRFTLNLTRADMIRCGFSPSVRLFEAAACGSPIISDKWQGLDELFTPGEEILLTGSTSEVMEILSSVSEKQRVAIGRAARERILAHHTADVRAAELEAFLMEAIADGPSPDSTAAVA